MHTFTDVTTYKTLTCGECGVAFAMTDDFYEARRQDHRTFFCPAGHKRYFPAKSDLEIARDALAKEKHAREQAAALAESRLQTIYSERNVTRHVERRLSATRGVVTRHKKRIAAGKCPCCSATFKDLGSHMKNRHPQWNPEKEAEVCSL